MREPSSRSKRTGIGFLNKRGSKRSRFNKRISRGRSLSRKFNSKSKRNSMKRANLGWKWRSTINLKTGMKPLNQPAALAAVAVRKNRLRAKSLNNKKKMCNHRLRMLPITNLCLRNNSWTLQKL